MAEFLQLAQTYKSDKHDIRGWLLSEKLDGERCFWDGGYSLGKRVSRIPYANKINKHKVSTGLWTRYGKVVRAPDSFIDAMPRGTVLDGELYTGNLQRLSSIVKRDDPDSRWGSVKFHVFDSPMRFFTTPRTVNNPHFKLTFDGLYDTGMVGYNNLMTFYEELSKTDNKVTNDTVILHKQVTVYSPDDLKTYMELFQGKDVNAEGCIIRNGYVKWEPVRSNFILKHKFKDDGRGVVIEELPGKGRLEGKLGSIRVRVTELAGKEVIHGPIFKIGTGFSDAERTISYKDQEVKFTYSRLTNNGTPKEARFDGPVT